MPSQRTIIETVDPEVAEGIASRRDALRTFGAVAAAASFPVAFAAAARKAFAQGGGSADLPQNVVDVLQFALTLERLEANFYEEAVGTEGLIPDDVMPVFEVIRDHERAHVEFIENALGETPQDGQPAQFDFTAGGKFPAFEDYKTFLLLSQAFEDTGVRAYKGQASKLVGQPQILTAALSIHSVEARHAARVRMLRGQQAWIPFTQPEAPKAVAPVYMGMGETVKYDVDVVDVSTVEAKQVTESFDEALSKQEVLSIVKPFLA